eukprot:m.145269 g.145269  ORF g.145269 m.145269 type:complete len:738 (-) comp15023_c0_seq3:25-2238(-)
MAVLGARFFVGSALFLGRQTQRKAPTHVFMFTRCFAAAAGEDPIIPLERIRNIGISAHIDSGKTTLTERILFFTGKIKEMHEVKGKDEVGATMDSMELEREKGITIQSAATYTSWKDHNVNIIDTPGHVDFTIEVERALRVLDGAVLVLCSVGGVQSQTLTVNRQMRRYNVPCIAFINKLDRPGANPMRVVDQLNQKLRHNAATLHLPIGVESNLKGVVEILTNKAIYFEGENGTVMREEAPPESMKAAIEEARSKLFEALANVDDEFAHHYLEGELTNDIINAAIRRNTLKRTFTPVMMGSALKNTGVQLLLDGVCSYLPSPKEVPYEAIDATNPEERVPLVADHTDTRPFVGLAFKLERGQFGQLTYIRTYQGVLRRGDFIYNQRDGKKIKIPRVVRMHADQMVDVKEVRAGEICAMFGVDCNSGDTFTDGKAKLLMESMYVPEPVLSVAMKPKLSKDQEAFAKAIARFQKQDPTFRVHTDEESKETIVSGMGELHLEIYQEIMLREYNCPTVSGKPKVAYRETLSNKAEFDYIHKKQSGGSGQYGRVIGYLQPHEGIACSFTDVTVGQNIPKNFIPSIEKGFLEACSRGPLTGHPMQGVEFVLQDGATHVVDSNDLSFRLAAIGAVRQAVLKGGPVVLEPIMLVEVSVPDEYQGGLVGVINKRKGSVTGSDSKDGYSTLQAQVPLNDMFGFSAELRSTTQGKGEFTMEYLEHRPVLPATQLEMVKAHEKTLASK